MSAPSRRRWSIRRGSLFDNTARLFSVVFDAVPQFWFGLLLIMFFSVQLGWLPVGGRLPLNEPNPSAVDHLRCKLARLRTDLRSCDHSLRPRAVVRISELINHVVVELVPVSHIASGFHNPIDDIQSKAGVAKSRLFVDE